MIIATACCNHDHCYSTSTFSKGSCDLQFLREMVSACPNLPFWIKYLGPIGAALNGIDNVCLILATGFYGAVALFGEDAYNDAQDKQKLQNKEDVCVAKCPTTQESGGRGTTTLVVDVLANSGTFPIFYEMYDIPDQLTITYEGNTIFTTGGLVSGSKNVDVSFSGSTSIVEATIFAPNAGTVWDVSIAFAFE